MAQGARHDSQTDPLDAPLHTHSSYSTYFYSQ